MRCSSRPVLLAAIAAAACADSQAGFGGAVGPSAGTALDPDDPLDFGPVPSFELVAQTGERVGLEDLRGRPFVVAAIFTTCYGPCPRISRGMSWLQNELDSTDARLVSITVDPTRDSPEVLATYAESWGADPERWLFLTGSEQEIERFLRDGLYLGVERRPGGATPDDITHSTRLAAVDRNGRLRGWYDGEDERELEKLRDRILFLCRETH